jgi:hypothetical protein
MTSASGIRGHIIESHQKRPGIFVLPAKAFPATIPTIEWDIIDGIYSTSINYLS